MSNSTKFWDKIADKYSKQPIADEASYQQKLQVTQEYFKSDRSVLEFGCGTGSTAIIHAPYVKHIRAIDISANMISIAKREFDKIRKPQGVERVILSALNPEKVYSANRSKQLIQPSN